MILVSVLVKEKSNGIVSGVAVKIHDQKIFEIIDHMSCLKAC